MKIANAHTIRDYAALKAGVAAFTMVSAGLINGVSAQTHSEATDMEAPTYASDVAEIINDNCAVCHRDGGIAPMALTTYDDASTWAPLISMKVVNEEMPPYSYDRNVGIQDLDQDWRLSMEEIDTIAKWAEQGAPLGDPEMVPEPYVAPDTDKWTFEDEFGEPDLVLSSTPVDVPAGGQDLWHMPINATGLEQDRCIRAMQVKPAGDAVTVVHHANTYFMRPNEDGELIKSDSLTEYAMGKVGEIVPEGTCRKMEAGSYLEWDIHLYPGGVGSMAPGTVVKDNVVETGIWFYPEDYEGKYEQNLRLYQLSHGELVMEPNGTAVTMGMHSFDHPVRIDSFQPHGHLRMVAASLEVFYPETGELETISMISDWSAQWHHSHLYSEDSAPLVPAGAVIIGKQWYDNTADNPNNPDPDMWVEWGDRTADEMTHIWVALTHLDQEGYEELLAERDQSEAEHKVANNE